MHPVEGSQFTDGELNNAMGSDFYQRDRNIKQQKRETTENTAGDDIGGEEDSD